MNIILFIFLILGDPVIFSGQSLSFSKMPSVSKLLKKQSILPIGRSNENEVQQEDELLSSGQINQPRLQSKLLSGLGQVADKAVQKMENRVGKAVKTVRDIGNEVVSLGGRLIDLVEDTASKIPQIALGGLGVFGDFKDNLVPLTLDLTEPLNFFPNMDRDVQFYLYNQHNLYGTSLKFHEDHAIYNKSYLRDIGFDFNSEVVIVSHGWKNSHNSSACQLVKDAYLKRGNYNVILVDWNQIAKHFYVFAAKQVTKVGQHVSKLINSLLNFGLFANEIRLIGHSLGAHVAGLAGYYAHEKPLYVTGCDPALPLFFSATPESVISQESGQTVEIIHTNAGYLGFKVPLGHLDFYPNGGEIQNGCSSGLAIDPLQTACSHSRSYEYLAESIAHQRSLFEGRRCHDAEHIKTEACHGPMVLMGTIRDKVHARGVFYLETNEKSHFAEDSVKQ